MKEAPNSIPVAWISKEDLLAVAPNHSGAIEELSDTDIDEIASKVSDALQDFHHEIMTIILSEYVNRSENE